MMAQNIHYYFKWEERVYSEEILDQSKAETQPGKPKSHSSLSSVKELSNGSAPPAFPPTAFISPLSWATSTPCIQLSLADIPRLWHVQHLGVTTLSQLHTVASHILLLYVLSDPDSWSSLWMQLVTFYCTGLFGFLFWERVVNVHSLLCQPFSNSFLPFV